MTGRRFILILALIGLTAQTGLLAQGGPPPQAGPPAQGGPPMTLILKISPALPVKAVAAALNGTVIDSIPGTDSYLVSAPSLPAPALAALFGVQAMEVNTGVSQPASLPFGIVGVPPNTPADFYKYQPFMQRIHSADAMAYSTGRGVVIADINSNVDVAHPALVGHLTGGYDFVSSKSAGTAALNQSSSSFMDQSSSSFMDKWRAKFVAQPPPGFMNNRNPAYSHGTLCAGVIAIVAPDSMIMPLRVFDDNGSADIFTIAKAIRYAVQNGAQVINMSFGTLQPSDTLKSAIDFALSKNVTLVASAGNNNTSSPQYPAAYSGVITTAATDPFDKKASFSNYGKVVFVDAPGVNVFSAYPGNQYSVVSGTSFSAPIIAGTAALIRSLRTTNISNSVAGGAINIDANNPTYALQLGYGRIDALRAVHPN